MRELSVETIEKQVASLCLTAAFDLPQDVHQAIACAVAKEESALGRSQLEQLIENAGIAAKDRVPLCQDTGVAVYFVELGQDLRITGGTLFDAITRGTAAGWKAGYLRNSVVEDPLFTRKNTGINGPPVFHVELVPGDGLKITLAPKGGGSENMSRLIMMKPTQGPDAVVDFIVETILLAGGNPCPPVIIGVGIGGNFETAPKLAKKALLRHVGEPHPDPRYAAFEQKVLDRVNATGVGPQGLGGRTTALAVHVEIYPCHMASLPVAVNLNCHAARHATIEL